MRFTFKPGPGGGKYRGMVQVFSVKIAEINGNLQWPIDVFGMIALRDSLDQNRNIIFDVSHQTSAAMHGHSLSMRINLNRENMPFLHVCP
jgi:hypothetical protein